MELLQEVPKDDRPELLDNQVNSALRPTQVVSTRRAAAAAAADTHNGDTGAGAAEKCGERSSLQPHLHEKIIMLNHGLFKELQVADLYGFRHLRRTYRPRPRN